MRIKRVKSGGSSARNAAFRYRAELSGGKKSGGKKRVFLDRREKEKL